VATGATTALAASATAWPATARLAVSR
jgi:hypothetical protein